MPRRWTERRAVPVSVPVVEPRSWESERIPFLVANIERPTDHPSAYPVRHQIEFGRVGYGYHVGDCEAR